MLLNCNALYKQQTHSTGYVRPSVTACLLFALTPMSVTEYDVSYCRLFSNILLLKFTRLKVWSDINTYIQNRRLYANYDRGDYGHRQTGSRNGQLQADFNK